MMKSAGRLIFSFIAVIFTVLSAMNSSVLAQTPTPLNYVYMPEIYTSNGTDIAYPVNLANNVPLDQVIVPIAFVPGTYVRIDSVSLVGSRLDALGTITQGFDLALRHAWVIFDADNGTPLPAGDGLLATVHIRILTSATAHDICVDSLSFLGLSYALRDVSGTPVQDQINRGTIHVFTQRPVIELDPETFYFIAEVGSNPPVQNLAITNLGVDPLNWDITYKPTWLNLSMMNGTAPSDVDLSPDVTGLAIGIYEDSLEVHDEIADPKFRRAYITLEIVEQFQPIIGLDPVEFFFSTDEGVNPPSQFMDITNLGTGTLNWDITHKPDWLTLVPNAGTAPSTTELVVDVSGLLPGLYDDSIAVHDANATPTEAWAQVHLEVIDVPDAETRCIALHEGWNLISWNLDTEDDDVESIIANIKGCIDGIFGFEMGAATYDPDLPQFSTLLELDHLHGYWFRMECDTVLCVTGIKADPETPIDLEYNWNLVSYLPDDDNATEIGLQSMIDDLVVALGYDNAGLTFDPTNPELATLETMSRDFGYWLKCTAATTLVYPGAMPFNGYPHSLDNSMKYAPMSYDLVPTREWVNMFGEAITLDGQLIRAGSVLELFDESGNLCGRALVSQDGKLDFTPVYFDDKSTQEDEGIEQGGRINLSIDGEAVSENFDFRGFGERIQISELNSVIKLSDALPREFKLGQNYPNPFNPSTMITFSLPTASQTRIEIFNLLGERVNVLLDRYLPAGNYSVTWNGDEISGARVSSGMYFYRLRAGEFSHTRKMMLVK